MWPARSPDVSEGDGWTVAELLSVDVAEHDPAEWRLRKATLEEKLAMGFEAAIVWG